MPHQLESFGVFWGSAAGPPPLDRVEELYIERILADCAGDKKAAAGILGIALKTLYNRINRVRDREEAARAAEA